MQGSVKRVDCYRCVGRDAEHVSRCTVPSQCFCYFIPVPDAQMRPFRGQAEEILCLLLRRYVYGNTDEPFAFAVLPGYAASTPADPTKISIRQQEAIFKGVLTLRFYCLFDGSLPKRTIVWVNTALNDRIVCAGLRIELKQNT